MSRYDDSEAASQNEGEEEEQAEELELPEMWQYVNDNHVGKLMKYLVEKGDDEDIALAVQERHPATGQSVLMALLLSQKFVAVEWLLKKFGRAAFAFQNQGSMTIAERWEEELKAAEERALEKQRIE
eukprot:161218_1